MNTFKAMLDSDRSERDRTDRESETARKRETDGAEALRKRDLEERRLHDQEIIRLVTERRSRPEVKPIGTPTPTVESVEAPTIRQPVEQAVGFGAAWGVRLDGTGPTPLINAVRAFPPASGTGRAACLPS